MFLMMMVRKNRYKVSKIKSITFQIHTSKPHLTNIHSIKNFFAALPHLTNTKVHFK